MSTLNKKLEHLSQAQEVQATKQQRMEEAHPISAPIPLPAGSAKKFKCTSCDIKFLFAESYKAHMESTHLKQGKHKCDADWCDYTTNYKYQLVNHKTTHALKMKKKKPDWYCKLHDEIITFQSKRSKEQHDKEYHDPARKGGKCPNLIKEGDQKGQACGRQFSTQYKLTAHINNECPHRDNLVMSVCSICSKEFFCNRNKNRHQKNVHKAGQRNKWKRPAEDPKALPDLNDPDLPDVSPPRSEGEQEEEEEPPRKRHKGKKKKHKKRSSKD